MPIAVVGFDLRKRRCRTGRSSRRSDLDKQAVVASRSRGLSKISCTAFLFLLKCLQCNSVLRGRKPFDETVAFERLE